MRERACCVIRKSGETSSPPLLNLSTEYFDIPLFLLEHFVAKKILLLRRAQIVVGSLSQVKGLRNLSTRPVANQRGIDDNHGFGKMPPNQLLLPEASIIASDYLHVTIIDCLIIEREHQIYELAVELELVSLFANVIRKPSVIGAFKGESSTVLGIHVVNSTLIDETTAGNRRERANDPQYGLQETCHTPARRSITCWMMREIPCWKGFFFFFFSWRSMCWTPYLEVTAFVRGLCIRT